MTHPRPPVPRAIRPQRHPIESGSFAAAGHGAWTPVFPAHRRVPLAAIQFGERTANFEEKLDPIVPEIGVLESNGLAVAGADGLLVSLQGDVLVDHSWFRGHFDQMKVPSKSYRTRTLRGKALTLASDWSSSSYGHFIQDCLPRLAILRQLGRDPALFDHVISPAPSASAEHLLAAAGVDRGQLVTPSPDEALVADRLLAPTFPGVRRGMESWAGSFFRDTYRFLDGRGPRRLYVARRTRKPRNEAAVLDAALDRGFVLYRPEEDQERQAAAFAAADAIIASSGSALANIAFCRPGTRVLELVPTDHAFPYYCSMANALDLRYAYILCPSERERSNNSIGPSHSDFTVDEGAFRQALDWLMSS